MSKRVKHIVPSTYRTPSDHAYDLCFRLRLTCLQNITRHPWNSQLTSTVRCLTMSGRIQANDLSSDELCFLANLKTNSFPGHYFLFTGIFQYVYDEGKVPHGIILSSSMTLELAYKKVCLLYY